MSKQQHSLPSIELFKEEYKRVRLKKKYWKKFRSTVNILIVVAATAILISSLAMPALKMYGGSMTDTLHHGDIVLSYKSNNIKQGDILAFYYNNEVLVKRVIGRAGDWIDIDDDGNVMVNGKSVDEPYITGKAKGDCDITLPYQVPDGRLFVMGDHRSTSVDSRSTKIGCVAEEQLVGKLFFRIWPLNSIGRI